MRINNDPRLVTAYPTQAQAQASFENYLRETFKLRWYEKLFFMLVYGTKWKQHVEYEVEEWIRLNRSPLSTE